MLSTNFVRKLCDQSFYHFVRLIGGSVGQGGCITEEIHRPLCDFWQDDSIKRKAICMPRNWLKSTVFTQWGSIWRYLRDPNARILIVSQNQDLASRFLHFIKKQLMVNPMLRKVYRDCLEEINKTWTGNKENRWSSKYVDLPRPGFFKEPSITSIGVGGAAQSGHYPFVFMDDPVGQKHIDSGVELEKVLRYHDNLDELLENPNFMEPDASLITLVFTFWGPGDYGTYVLKNYPEYHWRITPGLKDVDLVSEKKSVVYIQNKDADHFTSNWETAPKGKGKTEYYQTMLANPEKANIFWSQIMNNPKRGTGLNKFEYEWIRFYRWEERDEDRFLICQDDQQRDTDVEYSLSDLPLFGMIDPGGFAEEKLMKKGSRNAILIGGQPDNSVKKFVVYTWSGRLKAPEAFLDEVFKAHEMFHPLTWRIETIGAQQYIYQDILEACDKRGIPLSISPMPIVPMKGNKGDDIQALMNPFFNGEIFLHRSMIELIGEVTEYPHGFTNDLIDMLGKLRKLYFSRTPIEDLLRTNKEMTQILEQDRSPIDGY